ncbi:MAG: septum formation initiator family protein [Lachnospiraceae bacterium]|nr:septum formation initiator family protein [Lachnospiraceae bacterium]
MLYKKAAFRQDNSKIRSLAFVVGLFLFLFVIMKYDSMNLEKKKAELETQYETLVDQIEEQNARTEELKALKTYTKTKKYAEQVAKEKLGLVYSDEIVFKSAQ